MYSARPLITCQCQEELFFVLRSNSSPWLARLLTFRSTKTGENWSLGPGKDRTGSSSIRYNENIKLLKHYKFSA